MTLRFESGGLERPEVFRLLQDHLDDIRATSPPDEIHALDVAGLRHQDVSFWTVWERGHLVGCGALKDLGGGDAELKSMRTARRARGRGVGSAMLAHLLGIARSRRYRQVLLETGSEEFYAPARRLYLRHGFTPCPPFGTYGVDCRNVFMSMRLEDASRHEGHDCADRLFNEGPIRETVDWWLNGCA